jgi:hypothetical protein
MSRFLGVVGATVTAHSTDELVDEEILRLLTLLGYSRHLGNERNQCVQWF